MTKSRKEDEPESNKVEDRRHWARQDKETGSETESEPISTHPTLVDELKQRAEAAENKLLEYISAFKQAQTDQDRFRERLSGDVDRKVELKFGSLVADLLEFMDDLDLALAHSEGVPAALPLARGVALARDRFLATLQKHGVDRLDPAGDAFDPNVAEAMGVEPVRSSEQDGKVLRTLRPGYRMGERIIRPARVIVGRLQS
jgi:molecular chaperone GrpE (heat shock protein)